MTRAELNGDVWLFFRGDEFYIVEVTDKCTPERHAQLNPGTTKIVDAHSMKVLWSETQ